MRELVLRFSCALSLLLATCAFAATAVPAHVLPLSFTALESFGSDSQSILSLLQDRQGFIWIGTVEGGLLRYDGRNTVRYVNDPARSDSLPAGRIAALYSDSAGRIWAGTDGGLARFEPSSNSFSRHGAPAAPDNAHIIRRIVGDGENGMWIASWGGLQHLDPRTGAFRLYQHQPAQPDSLARNDVNAVAVDARGGVWAATWPQGLDYLAPGQSGFVHLRVDQASHPDPKLNDVRALLFDRQGRLWIGGDSGLVRWQSGTPWSARQRLELPPGRVNSLDADAAGQVWVGTRTAGLLRWDEAGQRFQSYRHRSEDPHSLPSNAIDTVLEDRGGTLWVATFTDGVSRANLGNYGLERLVPRDIAPDVFTSSNFVRSIAPAPEGRLWLGVDDGLALFDPAARRIVRSYRAAPGRPGALSYNSILSLFQAPGGPLWVGTSKGLNRLDQPDGPFAQVRFDAAADNFINAIAPGRGGMLWLATGASLIRYDPANGARRSFVHQSGDPASRAVSDASTMLEDSQGRLWVGDFFRGGGLDMLDPDGGRFLHFRHDPADPHSLSDDKVTCLHEDMHGTIWVGTTRGLNRMVPNARGQPEFRGYPGPDQPGPLLVEAITSDQTGILWISTVQGLLRHDPVSGAFTRYTADDGLTDAFYLGAAARATDGKLYFGSTTGITAIYPALPLRASSPPQVAITDIRIFEKSLAEGAMPKGVVLRGPVTAPLALTLPWNASVLAIEFAALHYAAPTHNSYSYWLEGFDQRWVRADARHPVATYTNLYPGDYRFHLRARNNKGLESDATIILPITVLPPFWQTWWFRGAASVLSALALAWFYRARMRRLTTRTSRLEALVAERTVALEQSNRKLMALSATDGMTGIPNRRCFDEVLAREWARAMRSGEPLALAMLDVDHFKPYNDRYGHQAGDDCLRRVAAVLAATVQRATDLAARYGGEEFAFIAPATSLADALALAEHVRAAIDGLALAHADAPLGHVTVSVGVAAMVPLDPLTPEALLRAADRALYEAKRAGRNRVAPPLEPSVLDLGFVD